MLAARFKLARFEPRTSMSFSLPKYFSTSRLCQCSANRKETTLLLSEKEHKEFMSEFPNVLNDMDNLPGLESMTDTRKWARRVVEFNVRQGKDQRPALLIKMAKGIHENLKETRKKSKFQLGLPNLNRIAWTLNFMQAYFLILDDIMDGSKTRRNRPCWYLVDDLGLDAINDGLLLESSNFVLLKQYVRNHYLFQEQVIELFHDVSLKTKHGQCLDLLVPREKNYEVTFTKEIYDKINMFKSAYYTFYLPVATALLLNDIEDQKLFQTMEKLCMDICLIFSKQDDFIDCFMDPKKSGKVGTDIEDGKCSWLAVTALQLANEKQKLEFIKNYGQKDSSKVARIKRIYMDLNLPKMYFDMQAEAFKGILSDIKELPWFIPKQPFYNLESFLYKSTA